MSTPRRFADLPGPRGLPLVGNALAIDKPRYHQQLADYAERYGPYFRLRIGKRKLLVVADHAVIGSVLRERPEGFRRPNLHGEVVREMGFEDGLFFANDETWKRQRRLVMAAFNPGHVKVFWPTLLGVAKRLETRWRAAADAGTTIDLQADLMRYTVDVVAGLAFGADVDTLGSDDDVIQRHLNRVFPAIMRRVLAPFKTWRLVRSRADRELAASVVEIQAAIGRFIGEARARLQADPSRRLRPPNLLEAMIVAAESEVADATDRDIAGNVFLMLLAGEDTTANTLAWLIDFLHRHPDAQARARDEVARVVGDVDAMTMEQLGELRWLDACIQETMRLKPVAPLLPSQANARTVVGDVEIEPGTYVVALMRHDALDAAHFPRPEAFEPARWLDDAPRAPDATSPHRVSMPFGAGPRLCPGRYLALAEMKIAMAMLLSRFTIAHVGTADGRPAREKLAFAMGPEGLTMRLAAR